MGASSSKAAAVQKAVSRVAAAPKPAQAAAAAPTAAAVGSGSAAEAGISAAEKQRDVDLKQRQQQAQSLPPEQAQENAGLVTSMNKVMAGMHQYQYELYRNPEVDQVYSLKKQTKEDKAAQLVGRLGSPALKQLLEDHARAVQHGKQLTAADLARQYGADADVLEKVLRHNSVPLVHSADDGRFIGNWPRPRAQ